MKSQNLSVPELMFIVATRAALAAGVALLVSNKLSKSTRRKAGLALMGIGGVTTIPAARIFLQGKSLRKSLGL